VINKYAEKQMRGADSDSDSDEEEDPKDEGTILTRRTAP
jgi:hypothetical protein